MNSTRLPRNWRSPTGSSGRTSLRTGQYAEALEVFKAAHAYNQEHGDDPEGRLMLEGYIGLTKLLAGRLDCGEANFSAAVTALQARGSDDAQFYAEQLVTARAVFAEKHKLPTLSLMHPRLALICPAMLPDTHLSGKVLRDIANGSEQKQVDVPRQQRASAMLEMASRKGYTADAPHK